MCVPLSPHPVKNFVKPHIGFLQGPGSVFVNGLFVKDPVSPAGFLLIPGNLPVLGQLLESLLADIGIGHRLREFQPPGGDDPLRNRLGFAEAGIDENDAAVLMSGMSPMVPTGDLQIEESLSPNPGPLYK